MQCGEREQPKKNIFISLRDIVVVFLFFLTQAIFGSEYHLCMTNAWVLHVDNGREIQPTFLRRLLILLFLLTQIIRHHVFDACGFEGTREPWKKAVSKRLRRPYPTFFFSFYFLVLSVLFFIASLSLTRSLAALYIIPNDVDEILDCLSMIFFSASSSFAFFLNEFLREISTIIHHNDDDENNKLVEKYWYVSFAWKSILTLH